MLYHEDQISLTLDLTVDLTHFSASSMLILNIEVETVLGDLGFQ